jgi:hypothetical protein
MTLFDYVKLTVGGYLAGAFLGYCVIGPIIVWVSARKGN